MAISTKKHIATVQASFVTLSKQATVFFDAAAELADAYVEFKKSELAKKTPAVEAAESKSKAAHALVVPLVKACQKALADLDDKLTQKEKSKNPFKKINLAKGQKALEFYSRALRAMWDSQSGMRWATDSIQDKADKKYQDDLTNWSKSMSDVKKASSDFDKLFKDVGNDE